MYRSRLSLALLALSFASTPALSLLAACGDDGGGELDSDAQISLFDAPPETPDAAIPPDAFVCSENNCTNTCCSNVCVDTSVDDENCNGCGLACQVGTHCEASECGECGGSFLPASLVDAAAQIFDLEGQTGLPFLAGFAQYTDPADEAISDGFGLIYQKTGIVIGQEYSLAVGLSPPVVLAIYDGSLAGSYDTAYGASAGTLVYTQADASCVSGTITGATFSALETALPPSVAPGGCTFTVDVMDFAVGDCGGGVPDAGVPDADAGPG